MQEITKEKTVLQQKYNDVKKPPKYAYNLKDDIIKE